MYISIPIYQQLIEQIDRKLDIEYPSNTINQLDRINMYRVRHSTIEYTRFSNVHGTFSHILNHKTSLSNFKRTQVIQSIFSKSTRIKLILLSISEYLEIFNICKLCSLIFDSFMIKTQLVFIILPPSAVIIGKT